MSTATTPATRSLPRILRVSVPASLLAEYDELDLDFLQACGQERFLRRRGSRLVSGPFANNSYGQEVLDYLGNLTTDLRITEITDDFEFFVVSEVPDAFLDESYVVIVTRPEPDTTERLVAIRRKDAGAEVEVYLRSGFSVRSVASTLPPSR